MSKCKEISQDLQFCKKTLYSLRSLKLKASMENDSFLRSELRTHPLSLWNNTPFKENYAPTAEHVDETSAENTAFKARLQLAIHPTSNKQASFCYANFAVRAKQNNKCTPLFFYKRPI